MNKNWMITKIVCTSISAVAMVCIMQPGIPAFIFSQITGKEVKLKSLK